MSQSNSYLGWKAYCEREIHRITPILARHGFSLQEEQPHIGGERYLMQAVTTESGRKLILLGIRAEDGLRVLIKASGESGGIEEIFQERLRRKALHKMGFAHDAFLTPDEIFYTEEDGVSISVQLFLENEVEFIKRPIEDQFMLALSSFKAQEGAHAATYEHLKLIEKTFETKDADSYLKTFDGFLSDIPSLVQESDSIKNTLEEAWETLMENKEVIEQYGNFLTHTDFVPHNVRVQNGEVYLLDHSSIRFGNKYEGWARFTNFMTLYNPSLSRALLQYVKDNRSEGENLSYKLMRIYRLGEIMYYYARTLEKSEGDLLTLNRARIDFWHHTLECILLEKEVEEKVVEEYKALRDSLRSAEEKVRQTGLH